MNVLIVSNQIYTDERVTNPVLQRMGKAMRDDARIDEVKLMPVEYSFRGLSRIRLEAKKFDIVHIHFGGMYALAIRFFLIGIKSSKVITFHGTDIHAKAIRTENHVLKKIKIKLNQYSSFISIPFFDRVGFVSKEMMQFVPRVMSPIMKNKAFVQALGVDYQTFCLDNKNNAQNELNLDNHYTYALFSDISDTSIKRRDIAQSIIQYLGESYRLNIMCGVKPDLVPTFLNASDFLLLTSEEEGSPNIVREALALNKPVFSVDVGDVKIQIKGLNNSAIISRDPQQAAVTIKRVLSIPYMDNTRETKQSVLDLKAIIKDVIDIYQQISIR